MRGIWSQEITAETTDSSLPPSLLGAKETRKERPFEKEVLSSGGLEQGFMSVTRKVILGGLNTSSNYTESHRKEHISSCEASSTLCSFEIYYEIFKIHKKVYEILT